MTRRQLIKGRPLHEILKKCGGLPLCDVVDLAGQAAAALTVLHNRGVVHRDIKPANIMLEELDDHTSRAVVLDLGVARDLAKSDPVTHRVGSPGFMAPEQDGSGRQPTASADVYGLAATVYAMLTGGPSPPHGPFDLQQRRPDLPAAVVRAVHQALAREPEARPQTPLAFAASLRAAASAEASTRPAPPVSAPPRRRMPVLPAVGALAVLALGLAIAAPRIFGGGGRPDVTVQVGSLAGNAGVVVAPPAEPTPAPTPSPTPAAPPPATVSELKVCDTVFACRSTEFVAGESVTACFTASAAPGSRPLSLVITNQPSATDGIVARADDLPAADGPACHPARFTATPLPAGEYFVWVLQEAAVLAKDTFRAVDPAPSPPPPPPPPPPPSPSPPSSPGGPSGEASSSGASAAGTHVAAGQRKMLSYMFQWLASRDPGGGAGLK